MSSPSHLSLSGRTAVLPLDLDVGGSNYLEPKAALFEWLEGETPQLESTALNCYEVVASSFPSALVWTPV